MPDEVNYFSIAKLQLAPGDILVVRVRGHVSLDTRARAQAAWSPLLPRTVKMLIIDDTIDLEVLTKADIEAKAQ